MSTLSEALSYGNLCLRDSSANSVTINVTASKKSTGLAWDVSGKLELARSGFLYSTSSKSTVWLKFAVLSLGLPVYAIFAAIGNLFVGKARGAHDLNHMKRLSNIAWKAVTGKKSDLISRVEEFSITELMYNGHLEDELAKSRSQRFSEGFYIAKCMQPLFHNRVYNRANEEQLTLDRRIEETKQEISLIQGAIEFPSPMVSLFFPNPHRGRDLTLLEQDLERAQAQLSQMRSVETEAKRCERYAVSAILAQRGLAGRIADASTKVEEVDCCGTVCYRHTQLCGIFHKVECCAISCFAIDCLCCLCCISPDLGICGCAGCGTCCLTDCQTCCVID